MALQQQRRIMELFMLTAVEEIWSRDDRIDAPCPVSICLQALLPMVLSCKKADHEISGLVGPHV